jgi:hypothetical protein
MEKGKMTIPVEMPALIHGAGVTPDQGACIMQAVAWLDSGGKEWNDAPDCVHPVLRKVAIWVNDTIGDVPRRQLWPLVPRLMGTAAGDRETDIRTGVQLAAWAAERVLPLITDENRHKIAAERIARARKWLEDGQVTAAAAAAAAADDEQAGGVHPAAVAPPRVPARRHARSPCRSDTGKRFSVVSPENLALEWQASRYPTRGTLLKRRCSSVGRAAHS